MAQLPRLQVVVSAHVHIPPSILGGDTRRGLLIGEVIGTTN